MYGRAVPAFLGPLVGLPVGALLAWLVASDPQRDERHVAARARVVVAAFGALVYAPICAYFLLFAGDWSYAYLVPSARVPSAVELLLVVVDAGSVVAGFSIGRRVLRRHAVRPLLFLVLFPAAMAMITVVVLFRRLRVDATYRQYHAVFGLEPIAGGAIGYGILWMLAMLFVGLAVTAREIAPLAGMSPTLGLAARAISRPKPGAGSRSD